MEEHLSEERLWGRHPVLELLRRGGRRVDEIAVLAGATGPLGRGRGAGSPAGVKVSFRTRDQLTAMAGSPQHQGVVARVAAAEYVDLDALLEMSKCAGEPAFLLALDQVQDPRNFGALLRTAEALGVHGVDRDQASRRGLDRRRGQDRHGGRRARPSGPRDATW